MARHYVHETAKVGELANKQVLDITAALSEMRLENDLRRKILDDIKRLKETGTYRGKRHAMGLPARGQNTRSQVRETILNYSDSKFFIFYANCTLNIFSFGLRSSSINLTGGLDLDRRAIKYSFMLFEYTFADWNGVYDCIYVLLYKIEKFSSACTFLFDSGIYIWYMKSSSIFQVYLLFAFRYYTFPTVDLQHFIFTNTYNTNCFVPPYVEYFDSFPSCTLALSFHAFSGD